MNSALQHGTNISISETSGKWSVFSDTVTLYMYMSSVLIVMAACPPMYKFLQVALEQLSALANESLGEVPRHPLGRKEVSADSIALHQLRRRRRRRRRRGRRRWEK